MDEVIKEKVPFYNEYQCSGCGVCAGVCSHNAIEMIMDNRGMYIPFLHEEKCRNCRLCHDLCSVGTVPINSSRILEDKKGFVGYSGEYRMSSASGGLLSYTLAAMLDGMFVDAVVAAEFRGARPFFKPRFYTSSDTIKEASGSVYYPMEFSHIVETILKGEELRYAVIALPCVASSLRKAMERIPKLNRRIKYILGLVCGQQKSAMYTEYILEKNRFYHKKYKDISYRNINLSSTAWNFKFNAAGEDSTEISRSWIEGGISEIWSSGLFNLPSCQFCRDTFAVDADMVFMDAWLSEYTGEPRGTSIAVIHNPGLNDFFPSDEVLCEPISHDRIIASQSGVIEKKEISVDFRVHIARKAGWAIPDSWTGRKAKSSLAMFRNREFLFRTEASSDPSFFRKGRIDLELFQKKMKGMLFRLDMMRKVLNFGTYFRKNRQRAIRLLKRLFPSVVRK